MNGYPPRPTPTPTAPRRQGMALALVLFMLGVTVIIGLCFLGTASQTTPVARLVDGRLQARMVAESGLDLVLAYVQRSSDWRQTRAAGQWLTDEKWGGGTFSAWGDDGEDADGDGLIDGNGNFQDDPLAPLTLRVVGRYGDVRHAITAVYRPQENSTLAAKERIELRDKAVLDSYDAYKGPYGPDNNGESGRAMTNATGWHNILMWDTATIAGTLYCPKNTDPSKALLRAGSAKVTGGTGFLAVEELSIAAVPEIAYTPSTTDFLHSSNSTYVLDKDLACRNFSLRSSAVIRVAGNVRVFCDGDFLMDGSSQIILENPRYGYDTNFGSGQNGNNNQMIATRVSIPDAVEVRTIVGRIEKSGKDVRFALYDDAAGQPGNLLVQGPVEKIQQDAPYWHETAVTPTKIPPGTYWLALSMGTSAPKFFYGSGGKSVHRNHDAISGGFLAKWGTSDESHVRTVNMYLTGNVAGKGSTLEVFTEGNLTIQGAARVNPNTQVPSRVTFWNRNPSSQLWGTPLKLAETAVAYATVHAPDAWFMLSGNARLHGVARALGILMNDDAVIYADPAGGTANPPVVIGEAMAMWQRSRIEGIGGAPAIVATCSVGTPTIWVKGTSTLKGDAFGGPGGAGNSCVVISSGASITGKTDNLTSAVPIASPAVPNGIPKRTDVVASAGTAVISSDHSCDNITLTGTAVLEIRNDVKLAVRNLVLRDRGTIRLAPGAKLTAWVTSNFEARGDSVIHLDGDPNMLTLNVPSDYRCDIFERAKVCATLVAPSAEIRLRHDAQLYGIVYCRRLKAENNSQIHLHARLPQLRWREE